jgi:hypothetical protein
MASSAAGNRSGIDITGGALLSKLVRFSYLPSERDPFISWEVVSPFVTEQDLPEILAPNKEMMESAAKALEAFIIRGISVLGVSSQTTGPIPILEEGNREKIPEAAGYAISADGQILRPGRALMVPIDTGAIEEMRAAMVASGLGLGVMINGKTETGGDVVIKTVSHEDGFAFILETLRVQIQGEQKSVIFASPLVMESLEGGPRELKIDFEGTKKIRQVGEIPVEP